MLLTLGFDIVVGTANVFRGCSLVQELLLAVSPLNPDWALKPGIDCPKPCKGWSHQGTLIEPSKEPLRFPFGAALSPPTRQPPCGRVRQR